MRNIIYRWEKMSSSFIHFSTIFFTRFLSPPTETGPPSKVLYLSPHSHHISSPPSTITQSSIPQAKENAFPSSATFADTLPTHYLYRQRTSHTLSYYPAPPLPHAPDTSTHTTIAALADIRERVTRSLAHCPKMCLQTIGICNLDHNEHLGFHFCSLLISRGLWNPFECSCFEAIEIESYHSSCQTCLEQSVGWKIYNDRSVTLKLWRAVSRKISHHRKRRSNRQSSGWVGWEMQNVCAVESASGVASIRSSKYGYLGD